MSARARVAFAAGVAGLIGAALLLTGRFDGNVAVALLFVASARAAAPATLVDAGPIVAAGASRALTRQMAFAPAWVLVVVVGALRAGSTELADVRGANAVAGAALTHGPVVTIAAVWLALAAAVVAIASRTPVGAETASSGGSTALIVVPPTLRRLEAGAVLAQAGLVVTLFAGPQIDASIDGVPWAIGVLMLAAVAWAARGVEIPRAPFVAGGLAAVGVALALGGGAP